MVDHIKALFPKLSTAAFHVTSERDPAYNCIAWAANDVHQRWWPLANPEEAYWPDDVPRTATLSSFQATFESLGYARCDSEERESGFEKVALFVDGTGVPTHAARQLESGRWTSKLGMAEDIEHELRDLEGSLYGTVMLVLKRPRP